MIFFIIFFEKFLVVWEIVPVIGTRPGVTAPS